MKSTPDNYQVIVFIFIYLWTASASAVCDISSPISYVDLAYSRIDAFQVNSSDAYEMDYLTTQLNIQGVNWRAGYEYHKLDFPVDNLSTPVTNGYLHAFAAAYRGDIYYQKSSRLNWEIMPVLAVSSNQLKNPDELKVSTFRLDGQLIWQSEKYSNLSFYAGACLTTLTGDYGIIPVAAVDYQYLNWALYLGYPHTSIDLQLTPEITVFSAWTLSGKQWEVLDKNLDYRNDVNYISKQLKLGVRFNILPQGTLEVFWLDYYDQEMEYLARNSTRVSADMENTKGWMLKYTHLMQ